MSVYTITVEGTDARNETWTTTGSVTVVNANITGAFDEGMVDSFLQLTQGKATYGKPGLTCRGPYSIKRITLERKPD